MRVALHTWNTGPAEAWDSHGNVVVETDLTDEERWVLLPDAHRARRELDTDHDQAILTELLEAMSPAAHRRRRRTRRRCPFRGEGRRPR